jgi:hypothetical protein
MIKMDKIKCPNCGSTAQVECVFVDANGQIERTDEFVCGCGCVFSVTYTVSSIDIQEN